MYLTLLLVKQALESQKRSQRLDKSSPSPSNWKVGPAAQALPWKIAIACFGGLSTGAPTHVTVVVEYEQKSAQLLSASGSW